MSVKTYDQHDYYDDIVKYDPVNHHYLFSKEQLKKLKEVLTQEEIAYLEGRMAGINESYEATKKSVIYKPIKIEGIDLKDYVSIAPYLWPNPDTADGLPYVRRDGEPIPEGDLYDKNNFRRLGYNMYYQSMLYYLTGNKAYYDSLEANVRYYLLDPVTGMNPNINHGQLIKGINMGRGGGIIDFTCCMSFGIWMLKQIDDLGMVDPAFKKDFVAWLVKLLDWLNNSDHGKEEKKANNNHGIFYDFGRAIICYFAGDNDGVEEIAQGLVGRMNGQIEPDGSMPEELARTKSKSYSMMGFKGITDFSRLYEDVSGKNMWNGAKWAGENNVDLKLAADYLFDRLVKHEKSWDYPQIITFDATTVTPLILACSEYLGDDYRRFDLVVKDEIINDVFYMLISKL